MDKDQQQLAPAQALRDDFGITQVSDYGAIDLYSETELAELINAAKSPAEGVFGEILSSEESSRLNILRRHQSGFEGPSRSLLVGSEDVVDRLNRLTRTSPSFRKVVDLFRREALASWRTGAPMRVTPLILLGPPGIGKTHLVNALALALAVPTVSISMSTCDDVGDLVGHSLSWKSARPGIVAKTLLDCGFASPIILVDEIEKAPRLSHNERPADVWHGLFEPENARNFRDEFLGLSMRADHILWIATANSLDGLPESVIDRTLVLMVGPPNVAESLAIARNVFTAFVRERSGIHNQVSDEVVSILAMHTPRTMKKILLLASGFAAERDSLGIDLADIYHAREIVGAEEAPIKKFGFV